MYLTLEEAAGSSKGEDDYEEAMNILDHHFTPQINVPFERHEFRQMNQKESETIDQFVIRLARQANNCRRGSSEEGVNRLWCVL